MKPEKYYKRIADKVLDLKLKAFGATNIVGPKWCGKTETALQKCESVIFLQKEVENEEFIYKTKFDLSFILDGDKPKLIDEWQDLPKIWNYVRYYCDEHHGQGHFILTGSTSKNIKTLHTGTGRISTMKMYPMSLYESEESNGSVSLKDLFDRQSTVNNKFSTTLSYDDLIHAACRGGWPETLLVKDKTAQLEIAKDYYEQIYKKDLYSIDDKNRNPQIMKAILRSYARNISTLAKKVSILNDVSGTKQISDETLDDYIDILERLYIVEDIYGWCPQIRSRTAMRSGRKREFVDPSIAVAALNGSPKLYKDNLKTFGFVFETLVIRDLKVYSQALGGEISYYHDNLDLECDCVLHLNDGRYALIEIKLGEHEVDDAIKNLNKIELLIKEHNKKSETKIRMPDLKMVITGYQCGGKTKDGIFVVPIGCLKD